MTDPVGSSFHIVSNYHAALHHTTHHLTQTLPLCRLVPGHATDRSISCLPAAAQESAQAALSRSRWAGRTASRDTRPSPASDFVLALHPCLNLAYLDRHDDRRAATLKIQGRRDVDQSL